MPDLPGMPATVRCQSCGFENTTTSLYCQDCGLRLVAPPSAIAGESSAPDFPASPPPVRTSARILSARRTSRAGSFPIFAFWALAFGAVAALVFKVLQVPADLPFAEPPLSAEITNNVHLALQASQQGGKPLNAPWSPQGLNAYLAAVLPPVPSHGLTQLAFQRALLAPAIGGFTLFVERKAGGITLYTRTGYRLVARGNGIGIEPESAAIGRLSLPASAAFVIESMNNDLATALAPDLNTLREARSVRITADKAAFDFSPYRP